MENMTRVAVVVCESGLTDMYYIRRATWKTVSSWYFSQSVTLPCWQPLIEIEKHYGCRRSLPLKCREHMYRIVRFSLLHCQRVGKTSPIFFRKWKWRIDCKVRVESWSIFLTGFYHAYPIYMYILLSWNAPLSPGCVRVFKNIRGTLGCP